MMVGMTDARPVSDLLNSGHFGNDAIRAVESLNETGRAAECPQFTDRLVAALLDGLRALDALPRNDPFWRSTNGIATLTKVRNHAAQRLRAAPEDGAARWVLVAAEVAVGGDDGGLAWLGPLIAADAALVDDAVTIADILENLIGSDASQALRLACSGVDREQLRHIARTEGNAAAQRVLALFDGDR
ncbi:hypothetical protein [Nocardia sp. CS682]|uniref:hypothetical protein n=1 Tax=Nocardia sp. CS682 TaxID=1047172 RepID=UPI0010756DB4|nr:hypothetical protein [Nocardia sp. CS682]QBS38846.1 hypothetical protein DMB37_00670 [Nocardia sp. CS682]